MKALYGTKLKMTNQGINQFSSATIRHSPIHWCKFEGEKIG